MQMAKTASAIAKLNEAGGLFISVLTDPTYGGVTASFASLRRYYFGRAKCDDWFCWQKSYQTNNWRRFARRISDSGVFARAWFCGQNRGEERYEGDAWEDY